MIHAINNLTSTFPIKLEFVCGLECANVVAVANIHWRDGIWRGHALEHLGFKIPANTWEKVMRK